MNRQLRKLAAEQPRHLGPRGAQQAARDAAAKVERLARKAQAKKASPMRRIKAITSRRATALRLYAAAKAKHLKEHPNCQKCGYKKDVAIHHKCGRIGSLLHDARYFVTLCRLCHAWVHQFPKDAQATGYLAAAGEWNQKPE